MAAYVISDIEVTDPVSFVAYKKLSMPAATTYGAKFLVRGGALEILEGEWTPSRIAILEFTDMETARGLGEFIGICCITSEAKCKCPVRVDIGRGGAAANIVRPQPPWREESSGSRSGRPTAQTLSSSDVEIRISLRVRQRGPGNLVSRIGELS